MLESDPPTKVTTRASAAARAAGDAPRGAGLCGCPTQISAAPRAASRAGDPAGARADLRGRLR